MNKVKIKGDKQFILMGEMKAGQIGVIQGACSYDGVVVIRQDDRVCQLAGKSYWDNLESVTVTVRILPPGTEITITVG